MKGKKVLVQCTIDSLLQDKKLYIYWHKGGLDIRKNILIMKIVKQCKEIV